MKFMRDDHAEILDKLVTLADGDLTLVERAIATNTDRKKPANLSDVVDYIEKQRGTHG